jgi:hypothetical protein
MAADSPSPYDLGVALNEANWRGLHLDEQTQQVQFLMRVLSLPEGGGGTGFLDVALILDGVSRIVAWLRRGRWDDENAAIIPLTGDEIGKAVAAFGGKDIYGGDFFDAEKSGWGRWSDRLSLDLRWGSGDASSSIWLFQEGFLDGHDRILDFGAWYEALTVRSATDRRLIPLDEFAAGGQRWWDAATADDERTKASGIHIFKPHTDEE